ncbi:Hypothetical protein ACA1_183000 [Acanthamoeba castellanii str. Neff]|uniref:Uncharacterized protein n=1 Tax=Acanthamoeba castellanii (strain ATCC 30010 / Neff) TaxID=1257118 RepID=L8HA94_ACACF|nr:Hypothetical protein ACA1_183000 [Acanthamoeba castellanii str. Neff]ELR21366.1 Hypothetical protein ACA1_183000 [Acanthamoeba castellanii str. Neff]
MAKAAQGRTRKVLVATAGTGLVLGTAALGGLWHVAKGKYPRLEELSWSERGEHLARFMRTAWTGLVVSLDYKTLARYEYGTPEYAAARSKAGQHLASMNHVLPREYTDTLTVLQDQAPSRPFAVIEKAFIEQLGAPPSHLYPLLPPLRFKCQHC